MDEFLYHKLIMRKIGRPGLGQGVRVRLPVHVDAEAEIPIREGHEKELPGQPTTTTGKK